MAGHIKLLSAKQLFLFITVVIALEMGVRRVAAADQSERRGRPLGPVFNAAFRLDANRVLTVPRTFTIHGKVAYLWDMGTGEELRQFRGHGEPIRAVTFSPDGKHVLTAGGREDDLGSRSTDNSARLWELATAREMRRFVGHESFVHTIQFSPDGKRILTASRDATTRVWEVATAQQLFVFSDTAYLPPSGAFSPDGHSVLGRIQGGHRVIVWDARTGEEKFRIERDQGFLSSAEFGPDGQQILTASSSGVARSWDAANGKEVQAFEGHDGAVHQASYTMDGKRIVTASSDGTVRLWNPLTGEEIGRFQSHGEVHQIIISPDSKSLLAKWRTNATRTITSGVSLWHIESGREIMRNTGEEIGEIVGFTPGGERILAATSYGGGQPAALLDAKTGKLIRRYSDD